MNNLNQILEILLENKIEFVVVGGYAAVTHGSSQVTKDIDVCAPLTPDQVAKLRQCLAPLHPKHRMTPQKLSFLDHPENTSGLKNLYIETDLGMLDVLGQITGVGDYETVLKNAIEVEVFGQRCKVISLEDLIRAKLAMGRHRDLLTVQELNLIRFVKEKK